MPGIERGRFEDPRKSAWSFEVYDSGRRGNRNERLMMERLEADPIVRKWTKKHGISIGWIGPSAPTPHLPPRLSSLSTPTGRSRLSR